MEKLQNLLNQSPSQIKNEVMEMYLNGKINTEITNEGPTEGDLEVLSSELSSESGLPFDYIIEPLLQSFGYVDYLKGIRKDFEYLTHYSNGNLEEYIGKDTMKLLFDVDKNFYNYIYQNLGDYDDIDVWDYFYINNPFELTKFEKEFFLYCVSQEMTPSEFIEDFNNNESIKINDLLEAISVILYKSEEFFQKNK
jgi:hypothetical protein